MPFSKRPYIAEVNTTEMSQLGRLFIRANSRHGLWTIPLLVALACSASLAVSTAEFVSSQNILNLIAQAAPLILVSIGQMIVILVRGLDLSVGSVVSLTTGILSLNAPAYISVPAVVLAAVVIGLLNGVSVTTFRVHAIIATLSMMGIVQGVTMFVRPSAGGTVPPEILFLVSGKIFGTSTCLSYGLSSQFSWRVR